MAQRDLHNNIDERVAIDLAAITADGTTVGNIIDTAGFESIEFIAQLGAVTDGTYTPLLEVGDDPALADAAAVSGEELLGSLVGMTASNQTTRIGYAGSKRYARLSLVATGVTSGVASAGAIAVLGHPHHAPVAQ